MKLELESRDYFVFQNLGDTVEGEFLQSYTTVTKFGEQIVILLETEDGLRHVGCNSNLALYVPQFYEGQILKITFVGTTRNPKTGFTFRVFNVEDLTDDTNDGGE